MTSSLQKFGNCVGLEQASLRDTLRAEKGIAQLGKTFAEEVERHANRPFGLVGLLRGEEALRDLSQHPFVPRFFSSGLPLVGERENELYDLVIEKWVPRFDSVGHGDAILSSQVIAGEPIAHFQIDELIENALCCGVFQLL
jgi:hypothetical protein